MPALFKFSPVIRLVLSKETLQKFRNAFYADKKNIFAQNVCSKIDPFEASLSRKVLENTQHVYTHKVYILVTIVIILLI